MDLKLLILLNNHVLDDNLINYYLVAPVDDVTLHANLVTKERVTYQGIIHQAKMQPWIQTFQMEWYKKQMALL